MPFNFSAPYRSVLVVSAIAFCLALQNTSGQQLPQTPPRGTAVVERCEVHGILRGHQGLLFVPENRRKPDSRLIAIHFIRFEKRQASSLPPVCVLPGGPGDFISVDEIRERLGKRDEYSLFAEMAAFNATRDVVVVNQRGHHLTPALNKLPANWIAPSPSDFRKPMSILESSHRAAKGLETMLDRCSAQGIDLSGYDILNLTDDVHEVREALGYDKIALRGSSFGSQWALAYLKRYPGHVDRAILSAVEPLDHTYDSHQGMWKVFQRIEQQVRESAKFTPAEKNLLAAVETIVQGLEEQPVSVRGRHPTRSVFSNVTIGADDFRHYIARPLLNSAPHSRRSLELWPKFVLEVHAGDYEYMAAKIIDDRPEPHVEGLLYTLIDNSLGISADRERRLEAEPARRWVGDLNWRYKAARKVLPPSPVDDSFRQQERCEVPLLMIHGDLDLATPIENAEELLESFPNAHLIRVHGGTHAATHHAAKQEPDFLKFLTELMSSTDPKAQLGDLPDSIDLPPLQFEPSSTPSLFKQLIGQ